jgi:Family of unknown function (DUF6785)/Domain of unknown function (DUF6784)
MRREAQAPAAGESVPVPVADAAGPRGGTPPAAPRGEGITWRGPVVGLAACAALAAVVPHIVLVAHNTDPMLGYMPFGALATLLVLARVWDPWVGRRLPALRLTRQDALLVYCMLLAVSGMAGSGGLFVLFPVLTGPFHYVSQSPLWEKLLHPYIPSWFAVRDPQAVLGLYRGGPEGVPWRVWAAPLAVWGIQLLLFFWTSLCLTGLFRWRWIHAEHLAYPLAQIPLEVAGVHAGPSGSALQDRSGAAALDRRLWIGAMVPLVLHSLNTLHAWFPNIPGIQLSGIPIGQSFVERPWSVMSDLRLHLSFATIGIAYLMPTELSYSFVFFYFFNFVQRILLELYGVGGAGGSVWNLWEMGKKEQLGAFAAFAVFLFWSARSEFRSWVSDMGSWLGARREPSPAGQSPKPDGWMAVGFLVGLLGMCGWSWVAGMSAGVALAFFAAVLALMLSFARMVSASGLPAAQTDAFPSDLLMPFTGAVGLGPRNLTLMAFQERVLSRRGQYAVAPSLAQAFKIADAARIPTRVLVPALLAALVVGLCVCTAMALPLLYAHGGEQLPASWFFGYGDREPFEVAEARLTNGMAPRIEHQGFVLLGALMMGLMIAAQRRFLWWPLHPMGFLMAYGWQITALWFSFLLGGLIVSFIQRFLGARTYWQLRPFFIGFILGEAIAAALWLVLDALVGVQGHSLPLFV